MGRFGGLTLLGCFLVVSGLLAQEGIQRGTIKKVDATRETIVITSDGQDLTFSVPAKGTVKAPWLSWGPYLWANGKTKRTDGLFWTEDDLSSDGTHPSPTGRRKVAEQLLHFFKNDLTAKPWFLAP